MRNNLTYHLSEKISDLGMKELSKQINEVMDKFIPKHNSDPLYPKMMAQMEGFVEDIFKTINKFTLYEGKVLDSIKNPEKYSKEKLKEIDRYFLKQVSIFIQNGRQPQSGRIEELENQRKVLDITYIHKLRMFGINEAGHQDQKDSGWHIRSEAGFTAHFTPVRKKKNSYYCGLVKMTRYNDLIEIVDGKIIR